MFLIREFECHYGDSGTVKQILSLCWSHNDCQWLEGQSNAVTAYC